MNNEYKDEYKIIPYRYAGIIKDDVNNGKGIGLTLFTQYCTHRCRKCHNPQTWSMIGGELFTDDILNSIVGYFVTHKYATRLTLSGGDPLDNVYMTKWICETVKKTCPWINIWLYSGYTYEEILQDSHKLEILKYLDVLIDGKYMDELRDITLEFRGSSNQRIINVQRSLKENKVILLDL